MVISKLLNNW